MPPILTTGTLSKIPEQSMAQLAKLLSSPDTPLASIKLDPEEEAEEIRASKPTSSWSWQSVWEGKRSAAPLHSCGYGWILDRAQPASPCGGIVWAITVHSSRRPGCAVSTCAS